MEFYQCPYLLYTTVRLSSLKFFPIYFKRAQYNDDLNATTSYNITTGSILSDISIINVVNEESGNSDNQSGFQRLWVPSQSWRVSGTLICCLLIYAYTLYLLTQEWIENVALRRAFFLEAGHYGNRMIELNKLHFKYVKKTEKKDDNDKAENERLDSKICFIRRRY